MTNEAGERKEARCVSIFGLAVCEGWGAPEPSPVGGAAICPESCGEAFCGEGTQLFVKRLFVTKPCLEAAVASLDHGGGAVARFGKRP